MKINFHRSSCIHIWLAAGLKPDLFLSINYMIQLSYNLFAIKILQLFLISNKTVLLINSFASQIWDKYQLLDLNQRLFTYQVNTLTTELSWYMQDSFLHIEDALPLSYLLSFDQRAGFEPAAFFHLSYQYYNCCMSLLNSMKGFEPLFPYLISLTILASQHLFQLTFECFTIKLHGFFRQMVNYSFCLFSWKMRKMRIELTKASLEARCNNHYTPSAL